MAREIEYEKWPFLTTSDNPYDPNKDWEKWLDWDEIHSYHTLSYIDRICPLSDKLSDKANFDFVNYMIDEAVEINPLGMVTGDKVKWVKCWLY